MIMPTKLDYPIIAIADLHGQLDKEHFPGLTEGRETQRLYEI
jgi:hypothetical protein